LVGIAIAPAAGEAFAEDAAIVGAERSQGIDHDIDSLLPRVAGVELAENRDVRIVVVDVFEPHFAAAELEVAVECGQLVAYGGDEIVVHGELG
jgi:hypothetical protein